MPKRPKRPKPKPHYPLSELKKLIGEDKVYFEPDATKDAWDDFAWKSDDIKKCLLKLNDKYHSDDRKNNHFHKTEDHRDFPNTKMDYYKCENIMEGMNVYTHFYIHPNFGNVFVMSFKEL
jgi:hypothetical protein